MSIVFMGMMFYSSSMHANDPSSWNPPVIASPGDKGYHSLDTRARQMTPALAVTEEGRLWATWVAGSTGHEDMNNYVVLATSSNDGETWEEVFTLDPGYGELTKAVASNLWMDPNGRLWLFWHQMVMNSPEARADIHSSDQVVWAMVANQPDNIDPDWDQPRAIAPGVMFNKPTVLSCGTWVLPIASWHDPRLTAEVWVSVDEGKTITRRGESILQEMRHRCYPEHMIIEQDDGWLRLFVRTRYGIGESLSSDKGFTWEDISPSAIEHPPARFYVRRLESGNILLVKHGPIDEQIGRSHLMAFISDDDAATWHGGLLLDERLHVSYPEGQQASDGTIYITYDHQRTGAKAIYMAAFTEEDVWAGENVSGKVRLRKTISRDPSR